MGGNSNSGVSGYQAVPFDQISQYIHTSYFNLGAFSLQFASTTPQPLGVPVAPGQNDVNFQSIFQAFFPGSTATDFQNYLTTYMQNAPQPFDASSQVGAFLTNIQQAYSNLITGSPVPSSSIGATSSKTDILNSIFALLVDMIGTLQKVAAAQANNLQILTEWQSAYTTLETNIHTFTSGDGTAAGGTDSNSSTIRGDLNSANQTYTENVRSRRSVLQDSAKALNSNLNQSNDSANQEANLCTQIIQEMSTILGSIYR